MGSICAATWKPATSLRLCRVHVAGAMSRCNSAGTHHENGCGFAGVRKVDSATKWKGSLPFRVKLYIHASS
jgi:hypothetical protein